MKGFGIKPKKDLRKTAWSRFWAGSYIYDNYDEMSNAERLTHLASIRRGIADFVKIMTGEDIPVRFSSGLSSYTGGKDIVISAENDPAVYDTLVGVAIHEALHLLYSQDTLKFLQDFLGASTTHRYDGVLTPLYTIAADKFGIKFLAVRSQLQMILNVIEDRRVDNIGYRQAVGFRPYYEARYNDRFRGELFDEILQNPLLRQPWIKCYETWIINMVNSHYDPDALPGLREITDIIDLEHIDRYTTDPKLSRWVGLANAACQNFTLDNLPQFGMDAVRILTVIYNNAIPNPRDESEQAGNVTPPEEDQSELDNLDGADGEEGETGSSNGNKSSGDNKSSRKSKGGKKKADGTGNESEGAKDPNELPSTPNEFLRRLEKEVGELQKVLSGEEEKVSLTPDEQATMEKLEAAKTEVRQVSNVLKQGTKCNVVVYKNTTSAMVLSGLIPFATKTINYENIAAIQEGRIMGAQLAYRLRILNDEDREVTMRQPSGHLDKRLIHQLGYSADNVFNRVRISRLAPVMVDLSIDASGSMISDGSKKWSKAITFATALAYASTKIRTLRVRINFRSSTNFRHASVAIVFDSKTDSFMKVQELFPYLRAEGYTPEGLAFAAIRQEILEDVKQTRRFFINVSDGLPYFKIPFNGSLELYFGTEAAIHTKLQIGDIKKAGIRVLSYFMSDDIVDASAKSDFQTMYGNDASFINPSDISEIVRTLNKLFLAE